jgi:hypothetical protein
MDTGRARGRSEQPQWRLGAGGCTGASLPRCSTSRGLPGCCCVCSPGFCCRGGLCGARRRFASIGLAASTSAPVPVSTPRRRSARSSCCRAITRPGLRPGGWPCWRTRARMWHGATSRSSWPPASIERCSGSIRSVGGCSGGCPTSPRQRATMLPLPASTIVSATRKSCWKSQAAAADCLAPSRWLAARPSPGASSASCRKRRRRCV